MTRTKENQKGPAPPASFKMEVEVQRISPAGPSVISQRLEVTASSVFEGGEEVGEIVCCLGGGIEIEDKKISEIFFIDPLKLWEAYRRYKKEEGLKRWTPLGWEKA